MAISIRYAARDHLANERTFLAWTRSSLALIALGVGLERFESLKQDLSPSAPPSHAQEADSINAWTNPILAFDSLSLHQQLSFALASTGVVTATHATFRYYQVLNQLQEGRFRPNTRGIMLVGLSSIGIFAMVMRSEIKRAYA